jgi:hypothetical protein
MGLVTLVDKGSVEQVKAKAADALAFARKEGWADQEVVVATLVAGALLKENRFDEAVAAYRESRQAALKAAATGHPAGQKMVLQTWFGEAGAQLAARRTAEAAQCYDEAASVAQQSASAILAIEAFRMGAFCHARMSQLDGALERGSRALSIGERMKPDVRAMTSLPIAAVDLLRTVDPYRVSRMDDIRRRLDAGMVEARTAAERCVAELERGGDQQQLRSVEDGLARETARLGQEAARELDAVAASAGEPFHRMFQRVRGLLGPTWPLDDPMAFPRAAEPAAGASATEGAAT